MSPDVGFSAIIPAGGAGSRLWPLSTPDRPKFLLDLFGTGSSLLQDTFARVAPLADRTVVVTGVAHAPVVAAQLPDLGEEGLVAEPSPRDSMPSIALAAALLEERHGPHVVGSFSADHVIGKPEAFSAAVRVARLGAEAGSIVVIGLEPKGPATGFGYIRAGGPIEGIDGLRQVEAFTEKPDVQTAEAMIGEGSHYWNAGMFVARTDVLLEALSRHHPDLERGVRALAAAWDGSGRDQALERIWPGLTRIAIDHAIAEPVAAEGGVAVVPADLDWNDIGDFGVLATLVEPGSDGIRLLHREAKVVAIDASGPMVVGGDRPVVVVGMDDVTVVDTPEVVLVLNRAAAQKVKQAREATTGL